MSLTIGAHMSMAKGFFSAYQKMKEDVLGNALQVFTKNPRGRQSKELNAEDVKQCQVFQKEHHFFAVAHCSYLLNFAKDFKQDLWPNKSLIDDIIRTEAIGGSAVVLHIGKRLDLDEKEVVKNIVYNIHFVLEKTKEKDVYIVLENTAGQGTEIGFRFEELGMLLEAIADERVKICFDTCHAFAAGYDLRNKKTVEGTFSLFDKQIGLEKLYMFHLNDTKKELGSRVDRHEDIGYGQIGKEGILEVVRFAMKKNIPCILETPAMEESYKIQVENIRKML